MISRRTPVSQLAALAVLVAVIAACSNASSSPAAGDSSEPTGSAAEIAADVFVAASVEPWGDTVSIANDEEMQYYLGSTDYPGFTDTAVVLPLVSIDARAVYVLKTASTEDAKATLEQLKIDVDPARLICVNFAPGDVATTSRGTVAFMVIDSDSAERTALVNAFETIQ